MATGCITVLVSKKEHNRPRWHTHFSKSVQKGSHEIYRPTYLRRRCRAFGHGLILNGARRLGQRAPCMVDVLGLHKVGSKTVFISNNFASRKSRALDRAKVCSHWKNRRAPGDTGDRTPHFPHNIISCFKAVSHDAISAGAQQKNARRRAFDGLSTDFQQFGHIAAQSVGSLRTVQSSIGWIPTAFRVAGNDGAEAVLFYCNKNAR